MTVSFGGEITSRLAACNAAQTAAEKGNALQELAEFVFGAVDGFEVLPGKQFNVFGSEEIDLPCYQDPSQSGAHFIDAFFLVECKNRSDPVPAGEVDWFIGKLIRRSQTFGIMLALNGISGSPQGPTAAHQIVAAALQRGIRLIVLTRADLERLSQPSDVVRLLKAKLGELLIAFEV